MPRSKRAPAWCSSIPGSSTAASISSARSRTTSSISCGSHVTIVSPTRWAAPRQGPPPRRGRRDRLWGPARVAAALARCLGEPHDEPDRDHQHGAEQEITPQPAYRLPSHVPDGVQEPADAVDDVPRVEADRRQHHAHEDREQDQPDDDRERRPAEKTLDEVVAHASSPRIRSVVYQPALVIA